MANIFDIKGKVIVVTGGLGQLGRNYSLALLESGAKVVVLDKYVTDSLVNSAFGAQANDESLLLLVELLDDVVLGLDLDLALHHLLRNLL